MEGVLKLKIIFIYLFISVKSTF